MRNLSKLAAVPFLALALFALPAAAQYMYDDWDTNADNSIDTTEFNTGFDEVGIYDTWDADGDGNLTEQEFNTGVYNGYDTDNSGVLEEPEFGDVGDDLGDGGFWDV